MCLWGGAFSTCFDREGKLRKSTDLINRGYGMVEDFYLIQNHIIMVI